MLSLSNALLFPRDFIFSYRAQSCSQEFSCQQHPFVPKMLLCASQLKAVARNSDNSVSGYPHHRYQLYPLPALMADPLIRCSQVSFQSWTLYECAAVQTGVDDAGGHSGGGCHRDRSGAGCTCSESIGCRLGNSVISQKWSYTFHF